MGRLRELLAHDGVAEDLVLESPDLGIMAFHGGSLERMTDVIAADAAARAGASHYAVRQPDGLRWHVPSREFDPVDSPRLASFLSHVGRAVAVHGYGREGMFATILVGGADRELAGTIAGALREGLDGYDVVDDLERIPPELRGLHPDNPVNRCRGGRGVQIELPPRARGLGPFWGEAEGRPGYRPHTLSLIESLSVAAASVITAPGAR